MAIQKINQETCVGCGICVKSCPADVIRIDENTGKAFPKYPEECVVCCICLADCPTDSITMTVDKQEPQLTAW